MQKTALITGGSIAGPALAYWLTQYGWKVTVVERHDGFRDGGQSVDLRGAGRKVIRMMGLEDAVRQRTTNEAAWTFVDANNDLIASFGAAAYGGEGPTAELEILRGELSRVLFERTKGAADYLFGDKIKSIEQRPECVQVGFESGKRSEYDFVFVAEGIGSSTRNLLWSGEVQRRLFNVFTAYFTIPRGPNDGNVARWYNPVGGRCIFLRPDNLGTTRASLSWLDPPPGLDKLPFAEQKVILKAKFSDAGWESARVLEQMAVASDFYSESLGQVKLAHWSKGRVALLGDAAYCASPLSGMGTSLAIVGAYLLAGELARHASHEEAFAAYERLMRPYVDKAQKVPSFAPRLGQPKTRLGLMLQHTILRLVVSSVGRKLTQKKASTPADRIDLPDYSGFVRPPSREV